MGKRQIEEKTWMLAKEAINRAIPKAVCRTTKREHVLLIAKESLGISGEPEQVLKILIETYPKELPPQRLTKTRVFTLDQTFRAAIERIQVPKLRSIFAR